jgi:hypothetical protein
MIIPRYLSAIVIISLAIGLWISNPLPTAAITCCNTAKDCTDAGLYNHKCQNGHAACPSSFGACVATSNEFPDYFIPTYDQIQQPDFKAKFGSGTLAGIGRVLGIGNPNAGLINYVFAFAGLALFLYLFYGSFILVSSFGNPKSLQTAKQIITNALIGFLLLVTSYWIILALQTMLGLQIL